MKKLVPGALLVLSPGIRKDLDTWGLVPFIGAEESLVYFGASSVFLLLSQHPNIRGPDLCILCNGTIAWGWEVDFKVL